MHSKRRQNRLIHFMQPSIATLVACFIHELHLEAESQNTTRRTRFKAKTHCRLKLVQEIQSASRPFSIFFKATPIFMNEAG